MGGNPHVQDALAIDLADPAIRRIVGRQSARGVVRWFALGHEAASIGYEWADGRLSIHFVNGGSRHKQVIETVSSTPHFGGKRLWFVCPITGAPVRALLMASDRGIWAGRRAHRLLFASQSRLRAALPPAVTALLQDHARARAREYRNQVRALRRQERTGLNTYDL